MCVGRSQGVKGGTEPPITSPCTSWPGGSLSRGEARPCPRLLAVCSVRTGHVGPQPARSLLLRGWAVCFPVSSGSFPWEPALWLAQGCSLQGAGKAQLDRNMQPHARASGGCAMWGWQGRVPRCGILSHTDTHPDTRTIRSLGVVTFRAYAGHCQPCESKGLWQRWGKEVGADPEALMGAMKCHLCI